VVWTQPFNPNGTKRTIHEWLQWFIATVQQNCQNSSLWTVLVVSVLIGEPA